MNLHELTNAGAAIVRPTKSGNGFVAGQEYRAQRGPNATYFIRLKGGRIRWISGIGTPSAHLHDGKDWGAAGHFEYLRDG